MLWIRVSGWSSLHLFDGCVPASEPETQNRSWEVWIPGTHLRSAIADQRRARNDGSMGKAQPADRGFIFRYFAPAFCAYSQDAFDSGTVRLADSIALALAAVPSRMRPAMPWVIPARRNKL
jgi:hypothetical protein